MSNATFGWRYFFARHFEDIPATPSAFSFPSVPVRIPC
jgi:hypothetical protein